MDFLKDQSQVGARVNTTVFWVRERIREKAMFVKTSIRRTGVFPGKPNCIPPSLTGSSEKKSGPLPQRFPFPYNGGTECIRRSKGDDRESFHSPVSPVNRRKTFPRERRIEEGVPDRGFRKEPFARNHPKQGRGWSTRLD